MPRKALIAANWKMYKTPAEAKAFVDAFLPLVAGHDRDEVGLAAGCERPDLLLPGQ